MSKRIFQGYMQNTALWMSLRSKKIEETPGQSILYIHAEHTAADHKDDSSRFPSVDM